MASAATLRWAAALQPACDRRMTLSLLTFSTLYPNKRRQNHGIFVENRLRHLVASGTVTSTVIAPVPWFPSQSPVFGDWALNAGVPAMEARHGLAIHHPRYPVMPTIGMSIAPHLLYWSTLPTIQRLMDRGRRFDAIDAHYVYPDGLAAIWIGQKVGLPTVVTARGTDINLIPQFAVPRWLIRRTLPQAAALITVSAALKSELIALGLPANRISVLRNGVNATFFRPADRTAVRAALNLKRRT
jgi:teichuronic acid biosynthesis glycosyltransferase TuaC